MLREHLSGGLADPGIGMRVQEVTQRRDELPSMRNIVAPNRHADVVDQHARICLGPCSVRSRERPGMAAMVSAICSCSAMAEPLPV